MQGFSKGAAAVKAPLCTGCTVSKQIQDKIFASLCLSFKFRLGRDSGVGG